MSVLSNGVGLTCRSKVAICLLYRFVDIISIFQLTKFIDAETTTRISPNSIGTVPYIAIVLLNALYMSLECHAKCYALRPDDQFVELLPMTGFNLHPRANIFYNKMIVEDDDIRNVVVPGSVLKHGLLAGVIDNDNVRWMLCPKSVSFHNRKRIAGCQGS